MIWMEQKMVCRKDKKDENWSLLNEQKTYIQEQWPGKQPSRRRCFYIHVESVHNILKYLRHLNIERWASTRFKPLVSFTRQYIIEKNKPLKKQATQKPARQYSAVPSRFLARHWRGDVWWYPNRSFSVRIGMSPLVIKSLSFFSRQASFWW